MDSEFDVIVAGVGSMGSAACYHLARRGRRVLGLEQFGIPHQSGSHHGLSRMIRKSYFEHPAYVPLLERAYTLWDELQEETGSRFFHRTGGLYIGAEDGSIVPGARLAAEMHGLAHTLLDAREIACRFAPFRPGADHVGFYEDDAGFLCPEDAIEAHAGAARARGARLHEGEPILSFDADPSGVRVRTAAGTYRADRLVLTAGAWTSRLASAYEPLLQVTRQVSAWFAPLGDPDRFAPGRFPCWFIETEPPFGHYGFPMLPGDPGLKIAFHKPGRPVSPEELPLRDTSVTEAEVDDLRRVLDRHLPGAAGELMETRVCLYTNSPDGHFRIGRHPHFERVQVACGFSGHGFKFASVIGEILAEDDPGRTLPLFQ